MTQDQSALRNVDAGATVMRMDARQSLNEQVSGEIRAELARANITQADFAPRCGLTASSFSRRMSGDIPWNTNELEDIARELGLGIDQLTNPVRR